jgi:metallo-beta-lactamase class B
MNRYRFVRSVHALATRIAFVAVSASVLARNAHAQQPANWTDTISPFRLIDNVHYVGSAGLSAWLITTPAGHILLDVGMPSNAAMVQRNIEHLGFKLRDVKILLNSHAHFDHAGGLAELKRVTGAKLIVHRGDRVALERGVYVGSEDVVAYRFPAVAVDSVIRDGATVTLGGVTMTANLTPGHTAGCTSWTMPVMDDGVRRTAIFFCSASVAANRLAPRPQYSRIVADYRAAFRKLKSLNADVFLAGHAELFSLIERRARLGVAGQGNPFVDSSALQRLTSEFEASFEKELARQRGGGR